MTNTTYESLSKFEAKLLIINFYCSLTFFFKYIEVLQVRPFLYDFQKKKKITA